jgi:hypothetical protein
MRTLAALALVVPGWAVAAPYPVVQVPLYRLTCRVLSTAGAASNVVAEGTAELVADRAGTLALDLPWDAAGGARLTLDVLRQESSGADHRIHVEGLLRPPAGAASRLSRTLDLAEGGTALLELHRRPGTTLVLALEVETGSRPVVRLPSGEGRAVVLDLAVERLLGDAVVPLETNQLHTFVGEPVEYAFRRGSGEAEEVLTLRLTPLRLSGSDVIELEVEMTGRLGGTTGTPQSRRERLLATRGSTSRFDAVTGTPPSGYRFRIRPDF